MHAWRGEFVAALRAMAAEQFALGQAVEERRVLFVAVQVVHLEMCPDRQRIHREHFGAALDFRKARFGGHRKGNVQLATFNARCSMGRIEPIVCLAMVLASSRIVFLSSFDLLLACFGRRKLSVDRWTFFLITMAFRELLRSHKSPCRRASGSSRAGRF